MKLKNKFFLWTALLLANVLLLGGILLWSELGHWRAARVAAAEYDAMDRADAASLQIAWLRDSLRGPSASVYRDFSYFAPLQREVLEVIGELRLAGKFDDGDGAAEIELARSTTDHLDAAIRDSSNTNQNSAAASALQAADELERVRQSLVAVSNLVPSAARHHMAAASERGSRGLIWSCIWLLVVLGLSIVAHYKQYQTLVRPLLWLRKELRFSAVNEYREAIVPRGDSEFREVAAQFNGLARELADLYRNLEQKVIARSRELVRSERLASVGFLAAGVSHEINNPLSVISGYAELAGKSLRRVLMGSSGATTDGNESAAKAEAEELANALEAQAIIRDEAFRCKEITSRLLSLARGGGNGRQTLCMDDVARQVTILTRGLKNYRDRKVVLDFEAADPLEVVANATEMKQVLLNLTVNALEAVSSDRGEVRIGGRRTGSWVELSVEDNGKGMSAETLEHVFEPFFTAKRGAGEPGTGLGLSITHTIVENHGGRIRAESRGPGRGSRFTVRLPATTRATAEAMPAAANQG